ncbi:MAG: response regulator [Candidatus Lambdaproteobacteria bacterium]|nr:response regulator [Candidatus Lambdaproteobacteria bacterium]
MASILIVDDDELILELLQGLLEQHGHNCVTAGSLEEAQDCFDVQSFELVLSDVNIPSNQEGLELMRWIAKNHSDTAVVMVSGLDDSEIGQTAVDIGAFGYIIKPFTNNAILINVNNALQRRRLTIENRQHRVRLEEAVVARTVELLGTIDNLEKAEKRLRISQEETILRLMRAAEFRDNETAQHIQRMCRYSALLARRNGASLERTELVRMASPLHDIGKIGTPDHILLKPGRHTPEEFELMKKHAEIGYRILADSASEILQLGALIAWTHHEKFDGSGYPRGLGGEDIPLEGRITAIADVFDALTSARVYKPAFPVERAISMMREQQGRHFDPYLLDQFLGALDEVLEIKRHFADGRD